MTFSPGTAAARLAKALDRMQVDYSADGSRLSSSRYIEVYGPAGRADDHDFGTLKIRLAGHEARPTYEILNGAADYEVGTHQMAMSEHWSDAAAYIARKYNLSVPASVARGIAKRRANRAAAEAQMTAWKAAIDEKARLAREAQLLALALTSEEADLLARATAKWTHEAGSLQAIIAARAALYALVGEARMGAMRPTGEPRPQWFGPGRELARGGKPVKHKGL